VNIVEKFKYSLFSDIIEDAYKEGLADGVKIERERIVKEVSKNSSFIWKSGTTQKTLISFIKDGE
jgi:hypothetical protein